MLLALVLLTAPSYNLPLRSRFTPRATVARAVIEPELYRECAIYDVEMEAKQRELTAKLEEVDAMLQEAEANRQETAAELDQVHSKLQEAEATRQRTAAELDQVRASAKELAAANTLASNSIRDLRQQLDEQLAAAARDAADKDVANARLAEQLAESRRISDEYAEAMDEINAVVASITATPEVTTNY